MKGHKGVGKPLSITFYVKVAAFVSLLGAIMYYSRMNMHFFPENDPFLFNADEVSGIRRFTGIDEVIKFVETVKSARVGMATDHIEEVLFTGAPTAQKLRAGDAGNGDFSRTNVQVEGIDEGDIVKTDGSFVYIGSENGKLSVINFQGQKKVCEVDVEGHIQGILLEKEVLGGMANVNQRVIVFTQIPVKKPVFSPYQLEQWEAHALYTHAVLVDLTFDSSRKCKASKVNDIAANGQYITSRKFPNGKVLFAATMHNTYSGYDTIIPEVAVGGLSRDISDFYYFPGIEYDMYSMSYTTLISFSFRDQENIGSVGILMNGQSNILYSSFSGVYVTESIHYSKFDSKAYFYDFVVPLLPEKFRKMIHSSDEWSETAKVLQVLHSDLGKQRIDDIITEAEKKASNSNLFRSRTRIHKFKIENGKIQYDMASDEISGTPLNQFALDEYKGRLRIATTTQPTYFYSRNRYSTDYRPFNNIIVLRSSTMKVVGALEKIAIDEKIFAARFMGDKLYLVTFKQTDPLFCIDVSGDSPVVLGELKIPGFSSYLHPYKDNLIGIGREGLRIKASLFDTADPKNPKELDSKYISKDGQHVDSPVLRDHHGFLFIEKMARFAFPVESYSRNGPWSAIAIFDIRKHRLVKAGELELKRIYGNNGNIDATIGVQGNDKVVRSMYIGDSLIVISMKKVLLYNLKSLSLEAEIDIN